MRLRDAIQAGIYKVINPFVRLLIHLGLTPNMVTSTGLMLNIVVAVVLVVGGEEGHRSDFSYLAWAGGLVLFAGLFDMLDGQVARLGNMSSAYGALYDSVLDRYSELILFLGICYYLIAHHYFLSSLSAFIALIGSMMVSYTRARAEGLGIESKGGLMQRPERIVLIGVSGLASGITAHYIGGNYKLFVPGIPFHVFETISVFTVPIMIMAVLTNITAINRLRNARKAMEQKESIKAETTGESKQLRSAVHPVLILLFMAMLIFNPVKETVAAKTASDAFPIPSGISNLLFYIQRTPNSNTVCYELNVRQDGTLDEKEPIHVFWLRFAEEHGRRKELSFIQRTFAYGLKTKQVQKDYYEVRVVAYGKRILYLRKGTDNKYHIYTTINRKLSILNSLFINIDGGTFWHPNITSIDMRGTEASDGSSLYENIKP